MIINLLSKTRKQPLKESPRLDLFLLLKMAKVIHIYQGNNITSIQHVIFVNNVVLSKYSLNMPINNKLCQFYLNFIIQP